MARNLWRTTIEIWTDYDPSHMEISDLAQEATTGDAYCTHQIVERIADPDKFPETEFFGA